MVSSSYTIPKAALDKQQQDQANYMFGPIESGQTVASQIAAQESYVSRYNQEIADLRASSATAEVKAEAEKLIRLKTENAQRRIDTLRKYEGADTAAANRELARERESTLSTLTSVSSPENAVGYNRATGQVEIGGRDGRGSEVVSISKSDEQIRAERQGYTKTTTLDPRSAVFKPVEGGIFSPGIKAAPPRTARSEYSAEPQRSRAKAETGQTEKLFANIPTAPIPSNITPRKQRAKAQQNVPDKLFLNPSYITTNTKEAKQAPTLEGFAPSVRGQIKTSKRVAKDYTLSLTENITTEKQKTPQNFAVSLVEGRPTEPKKLTQAQVDKMTPEQYAVYKAEIDNYNRFVASENKRIKKENTESLNQSLRGLKTFIDEQKAAGVKTITINTDQGEKRVPIGEAYLAIQRTKNVKGIYTDQVIPEGYTVAGLSNMVFIEAPEKTIGPQPTPYFAEQVKIDRFTGLDLGAMAPITKGIDTTFETYKPVEGRSELNQRLTGIAAPFVNIGTITYDTGKAIAKEIRKPGSGFEFRGTDIAAGGNPLNLPYAKSETPTQRTAFGTLLEGKLPDITKPYEQGTILGDIGLAALGAARLKSGKPKATEKQIGQLPEEMRRPKTAKEVASNLNDLYRPIPKLSKTPNQKFLEEIQMSELARQAMAKRSREISEMGADYARLRYDITKGKIDLEQIGVRLGQGKVTTTRGQPNPRWEKSGEAPESTALRETQQRNIKVNEQRAELDDILSESAMKRMTETEKKPELDVVTQRELDELASAKQSNLKRNMESQQLDRILSEAAMKRMTESKPLFEESTISIGRGSPKLMRLKGDEVIEPSTKYKTTIEKIAELRKNPELEEREPLKFYPKRRLGEENIDMPIDMTDRIDLGFQNLNLNVGQGRGFIIPKEAQQRNIKVNEQRAELDDILSESAMKRMTETEKKPELDVVTQRELDELGQLKQGNIEQNVKRSREPMLLNKEASKDAAKKLDLQSQITQDLATRVGFKSTKVPLGRSRVEVIKTGVAGSALVGPMPFLGKVIAEEVPPGIPPITNTTGTNQTEETPVDVGVISTPATQPVTQSNQNINAIVGRQGFASEQISLGQGRTSRRSFSQSAVRPTSDSRRRPATILMNQPRSEQERKQRPLIIQQRVTALAQPTPNQSVLGLRPGQPFPPIQPPTTKTTILIPPRRPPRIPPAFRPKRKKENEKRKLKELKPNDFLGNASQENISSNYSRQEIILGIKRTAKLERKDLAKERKGLPRFVNSGTSSLLDKTKPNLLRKEKRALSL